LEVWKPSLKAEAFQAGAGDDVAPLTGWKVCPAP
jgi:hypothetical protein